MKGIFLDIDGVLNGMLAPSPMHWSSTLPECIDCLNEIIDATGAKVFMISSWVDDVYFVRNNEKLEKFLYDRNVDKLYVAYWGRYFKYELCGEKKDINYDCESMNQECIEDEDWEQITELYSDNLCPDLDEKVVENKFGWPDRGGIILSVERGPKNKLKVVTEDYDFE